MTRYQSRTSLTVSARRRSKNKQKARTDISDIFPKYFIKLLEAFTDLPCLRYREKQVKSEPSESYSFPVFQLLRTRRKLYYVTK